MKDISQMETTELIDLLAENTEQLVSMMSVRVTHEEYILKQELIRRLQDEINSRKAIQAHKPSDGDMN